MSGAGKPDDETRPADPSLDQPVGAAVVAFWEGGYRRLPLVDTGTFDVGRGEQCEVRIDHPSVSRQHLKLHVGDGVAVEDVGSFNGSRLNGIRIVLTSFGVGVTRQKQLFFGLMVIAALIILLFTVRMY